MKISVSSAILILLLSGCSSETQVAAVDNRETQIATAPDTTAEASEVTLEDAVSFDDLLLDQEDFSDFVIDQAPSSVDDFRDFFVDKFLRINACRTSIELATEIAELPLTTSRSITFQEQGFVIQWVFDAGSIALAQDMFDSFSSGYSDEPCSGANPSIKFAERVSLTESLPFGFQGTAWVESIDIDQGFKIYTIKSISSNGRYLLLSTSWATDLPDAIFKPSDTVWAIKGGVVSFTDRPLSD